uniref:Uncharacterized protein n=1 Tax=Kalmanozyma brasiliensis (strain GHG001) TaxID=1365824 RepID=V5EVA4_KALBG
MAERPSSPGDDMLYDADPSISSPLALHAFRHVFWNDRRREYNAEPVGAGITRVSLDSVSALLSDIDASDHSGMDVDAADQQQDPKAIGEPTSKVLGWDMLREEMDDKAAGMTVAEIDLADDDVLDCVIKPDPTLALAPKTTKSIGRERSSDRFGRSRR